MRYKQAYDHCQKLGGFVSRTEVKSAVLSASGLTRLQVVTTSLDTTKCRGFYISANNFNHPLVKQFGSTVICVGRGQNRCWTRLVLAKEMMHIFDDPPETTGSVEAYEGVLSELFLPTPTAGKWSAQMLSEINCFSMAMGMLCPEGERTRLRQEKDAGNLDQLQIAEILRVPEVYIDYLFSEAHERAIEDMLAV